MRRRTTAVAAALALVAVEAVVVARRRGTLLAADTVVRCRDGHLFTTFWIPGASLKAIRLGPWRIQRCPVGRHWSVVTPVDVAALDGDALARAATTHDVRVP
jgi:hypothetical protein